MHFNQIKKRFCHFNKMVKKKAVSKLCPSSKEYQKTQKKAVVTFSPDTKSEFLFLSIVLILIFRGHVLGSLSFSLFLDGSSDSGVEDDKSPKKAETQTKSQDGKVTPRSVS